MVKQNVICAKEGQQSLSECGDSLSLDAFFEEGSETPSMDAWLAEAKASPNADKIGMYLTHNGVVRATAKAQVRGCERIGGAKGGEINSEATISNKVLGGVQTTKTDYNDGMKAGQCDTVAGMIFSYDKEKALATIKETYDLDGIYYVKVWMAKGELKVGDDIMYVLIGGDIRPRVVDALQFLVGKLKNECVEEREILR